jgi:hypothetical protein
MSFKSYPYTAFYAARVFENLDRITVCEDTGFTLKRMENLELGKGNPPGIDEIISLENYYDNGILKEYFVNLLNEGGQYQPMPRKVVESTKLEKYIALDRSLLGNVHIMTALDVSVGNAILIRKKLEVRAQEEGLILMPGAVIQTRIFEQLTGIYKSDFEDDPEVAQYLGEKGK